MELGLPEKHPRERLINNKNKLKDRLLYKITLLPINLFSTTLPELTNNQTTKSKDNLSTSS
jgi:hypothetical protein